MPGSSSSAQSSIGATAVFGPGTTSGSEQGPEGADCAVAPGGCTAEAFSGWGPEKTKEEIVDSSGNFEVRTQPDSVFQEVWEH